MRTHASVQPLVNSLRWIEQRKATHLYLIVDIKADSPDFGKCIKLGSMGTCTTYMADNKEEGQQWSLMTYAEAENFNRVVLGNKGSNSSDDAGSDTVDTTGDSSSQMEAAKAVKQAAGPASRVYGENRSIAGANAIAGLIQEAINGALDVDALKEMAESRIQEAVRDLVTPTVISVKPNEDAPAIPVGAAHANFPLLLQMAQARDSQGCRLNILLVGPAGTSKSTAAKQVAKALNLSFYPMSAIDSKFELFGFIDANGKAVETAFKRAWRDGGVFCFDELSASSAQAFTAFNGCLANGIAPFPDGAVERHPDCVIIAGDNVFGAPTAEYNGRNKMDAASMDRFVMVEWGIDPVLERTITQNDSWVDLVQSIRQAVQDKGIRGITITPRASVYGASLLRAGIDRKTAARLTMKKAMTDDQWATIERAVGL